ncbi:UPF0568 protein C14orf166-like protein [Dinothrombium tinctorium]|uniref:UPF0568 protein C14orf166-like protein n=1 Tax=Dinothrombium tinctorium TaxID=1965070 RepID=A0A3S4QYK2_9ACAR|nr:UPF0568 protein C14orf166-like protein [Dinothrombium tinctorium]
MFSRKLSALFYPSLDRFDIDNVTEFRKLVVWCEDQKIRHYTIEDRAALRNINSDRWDAAYEQYLKDISCPFDVKEKHFVIDWLLSFSLRLQYEDNLPSMEEKCENSNESMNAPKIVFHNPFDKLDFGSEEFKQGVSKLAQILKVVQNPDHLVTLKAISLLVKSKLVKDAKEEEKAKSTLIKCKGSQISIEDVLLGFDTGDAVLNRAAKVLRLLHINELRALQTQINELIVSVQSLTANPKTDTALGKVGR